MSVIREITFLVRALALYLVALVIVAVGFFSLGVRRPDGVPFQFWLPDSHAPSIAVRFLDVLRARLVPSGVQLIAESPFSAFSAQVSGALFLSFLVLLPLFLAGTLWYLAPALSRREYRWVSITCLAGSLLFLGGAFFGFEVIVPRTLTTLASYADALAVPQYLFLGDFFGTAILLIAVCGLVFLLPLFMPITSYLGIVPARFWATQWRVFLVAILIITALLTNDGTGMSMLLLSAPLMVCYAAGVGISSALEVVEKRRRVG